MGLKFIIYFIVAIVSLVSDLLTKDYMEETIMGKEPIVLIENFLSFRYTTNPGIAFGMMQNGHDYLLYIIPCLLVGILIYTWVHRKESIVCFICLGCILGGAIGNYWDRVANGEVRDFISVVFGSYSFPIFNLADAYISCGVAVLIVFSLFQGSPKEEKTLSQPTA